MSSGFALAALGMTMLLLSGARPASAQEALLRRFNLDKLSIASLGAAVGHIIPSQVVPTSLVALQADYGNVAPNWRLVFGASYWESRYRDDVVQTFVDSLRKSLANPADRVVPSRVSLYDITFGADLRYMPAYSGELKPFLGFGLAAHVINAEGPLVKGTFVERSLDDIAAGIYVSAGVTLRVVNHFGVEGSARSDLMSGLRSTQIRGGASYYFGHLRGTPVGAGSGASGGEGNSKR